jgi:hypothetical protein
VPLRWRGLFRCSRLRLGLWLSRVQGDQLLSSPGANARQADLTMTLTPEQLHILQHSLGCDQYGKTTYCGDNDDDECFGRYHRNRYVSYPNDMLISLVTMDLMKDHGSHSLAAGMHYYTVTQYGLGAMIAQSPRMKRALNR